MFTRVHRGGERAHRAWYTQQCWTNRDAHPVLLDNDEGPTLPTLKEKEEKLGALDIYVRMRMRLLLGVRLPLYGCLCGTVVKGVSNISLTLSLSPLSLSISLICISHCLSSLPLSLLSVSLSLFCLEFIASVRSPSIGARQGAHHRVLRLRQQVVPDGGARPHSHGELLDEG